MHGRIRMTIDPRIPTVRGWSTSGFFADEADVARTKRDAPCKMFGESHEG